MNRRKQLIAALARWFRAWRFKRVQAEAGKLGERMVRRG